jgi:hypothetical protein
MNGVMEMASEVRRTSCNAISLCGYSDFPRWVSRQHLLPIGPGHCDKSQRGGRVRLADD